MLGLVLGSLLCLSLCPACWRSRAFGRTEVRRAASRGQLRGRAGLRFGAAAGRALRALWVLLYAVRGAAFARSQLLFTGTGGSSEGRAQHASTPTPKCRRTRRMPSTRHRPACVGETSSRLSNQTYRKKNSVPQKTRAAPFLARFEGVVSGHARVRSHYDAPACAARSLASRASASARSRRSSVPRVKSFFFKLGVLSPNRTATSTAMP